ncbi:MAG: radical SAM protein [Pseudomonadota bacterium]|nr:radical SAM protein [Pseudomonadota bacterium]
MRVVLLQTAPWRPDMPPLGLPYVQAALAAAGVPVALADVNFTLWEAARPDERVWWEPSHAFVWHPPMDPRVHALLRREGPRLERALRDAIGAGPCLVGLTMLTTQKAFCLWLADRVRAVCPEARVVVGGPQCFVQYEPHAIVAHPSVDFVVVGEGEHAIVELVRWLEAGAVGAPPPAVLTHDGRDGGPRALGKSLDSLAFPDFTGLPLERYLDRGRLPIFTSRGCVKKCVYCIEQRIWERFRYRTADNVYAEIRRDVEVYGATKLEFNDSLFNGHMRVLEEVCDRMIASGHTPSWGGQGVIRKEMSPRVLAKLRQSGCGFVTYGFESASQAVLDRMKKHVDMTVAAQVIRDTHAAGIGQKLNLMFGFPGETEADFQLTLDFLTANARYIAEVNPSDAFTALIPGTELYERADDFGITNIGNAWFWEAGANDFGVRLDRFERMCRHVKRLGIASTYRLDRVANRWQVLGEFHAFKERWIEALAHWDAHAGETGTSAWDIPGYRGAVGRVAAGLREANRGSGTAV